MGTKNRLPESVREKLAQIPEYRMGAHKVAVRLRDGRIIEDVVVAWEAEIVSVGGRAEVPFDPEQVVDVVDRS